MNTGWIETLGFQNTLEMFGVLNRSGFFEHVLVSGANEGCVLGCLPWMCGPAP